MTETDLTPIEQTQFEHTKEHCSLRHHNECSCTVGTCEWWDGHERLFARHTACDGRGCTECDGTGLRAGF